MQVRCVKAFGNAAVGDVIDGIPDGAAVDTEHWEIVTPAPAAAAVKTPAVPAVKEGSDAS